jgi:hypothetical protein
MKWFTKDTVNPKVGDTKVIETFLLFPMTLGNETRWLEKATEIWHKKLKYCELKVA